VEAVDRPYVQGSRASARPSASPGVFRSSASFAQARRPPVTGIEPSRSTRSTGSRRRSSTDMRPMQAERGRQPRRLSVAVRTQACSFDIPGVFALLPRLGRRLGMPLLRPLNETRKCVSSASTTSDGSGPCIPRMA